MNYLQGLAASEVKAIADSLGAGAEAEAARAALHAVVGCVGAAASTGACGAGALGASASSVLGALMGSSATAGSEEKESRVNLISSIVGAISLGMGVDAVTAVVAARTEAENNYLKPGEIQTLMDDLRLCRVAGDPGACQQETKEKYEEISVSRGGSKLFGCKADGEAACEQQLRDADAGADAFADLQRAGWKPEELAILDGLADLSFDDSFIARKIWHSAFLSESGAVGGVLVGGALSAAAAQAEASAAKANALAAAGTTTSGAGQTIFRTGHYSSRLQKEGVNVAKAEAIVEKEIQQMRTAMTENANVSGRLFVDRVQVEYRARLLPGGVVNVGTIFPVK